MLRNDALEFLGPLPNEWKSQNGNPLTLERIKLGQRLFEDPRLSATGKDSCTSCHDLKKFSSNGQSVAISHSWQKEPRNVPTVLNAVFNDAHTQGDELSEKHIRACIGLDDFPIQLLEQLKADSDLAGEFNATFGSEAQTTPSTIATTREAYLSTLITPNSPFDEFMQGDNAALTIERQLGLAAFIDKGCTACHYGPSLGGDEYEEFNTSTDAGSTAAETKHRVRVTPLRNVAQTGPYFHAGHVDRLDQAVAMMLKTQLDDPGFGGEIKVITAFLKSLSDPVKSDK
jgi:cytochrome c peroxidase